MGEVFKNYKEADIVIMAAAVADFRPAKEEKDKIKKGQGSRVKGIANIELERTEDILSELGKKKGGKILVGFSVESEDLIKNSEKKLKEKNLDLIVANTADAFDSDVSEAVLISKKKKILELKKQNKTSLSDLILDAIL